MFCYAIQCCYIRYPETAAMYTEYVSKESHLSNLPAVRLIYTGILVISITYSYTGDVSYIYEVYI